ncbi:ATP-dependent Clp protease adaptor ClpS [Acinetobacter gyllenbergii]|uniref:Adaptor protein ClpS core domain-containing protein n=1 Tax=Acinetobacter gyllenbergii CIP 110306 = MTCC 11365 TaxID=1217657 RepID=A0A829HHT5_9GAMM|nr:ATP-dependent Clp protease adaptor ClpS [Acinetobacter gyllenbergii]EPF83562.1 hypothetical protein F957_01908 [Acinetobacter gyllenbergii CIP 110306 = MTCC 11365]MCU4582930.1 ATP-dependent Clp protease adaptor ClpS [Acinetobacter gyllenbergii]
MNNKFAGFLNDWISLIPFVIEFLQQYFVLNLDQDSQLMLTVDYEAKRLVDVYPITITEAQQIKSIIRFFIKRFSFFDRAQDIRGLHAQSSIRSIVTFGC